MIVTITVLLLLVQTPMSQLTKNCDLEASLEADPVHVSAPVAFDAIEPKSAIEVCLEALSNRLDKQTRGRIWLQLGRGYLKNHQINSAKAAFEKSVSHGYGAGYFALGVMYWLGGDIKRDPDLAKAYLEEAYSNGVFWSAKILQDLYDDKESHLYDKSLADYYEKTWSEFVLN